MIVAPGGGFRWLSMGNEGWEVAEALAEQGITAFVLKYRLYPTPESLDDFTAWMNRAFTPPAESSDSAKDSAPPLPLQRDLSNQLEDAPPMFNVIATDDFLFRGQFGVIDSWYKAGIPVEFHLYQNGGHGFGLGNPNRTSNRWFAAFIHWLDVNSFLTANTGE